MIFVLLGLLIIIGILLSIKEEDFGIFKCYFGVSMIVVLVSLFIFLPFGTKCYDKKLNVEKVKVHYINNKYYYENNDNEIVPLNSLDENKIINIIKDNEEYLLLTNTRRYVKLTIIGKIILFNFNDDFSLFDYDYVSNYELHIKSK